MRFLGVGVVLGSLLLGAGMLPASATVFAPQRVRLANGLEVLVVSTPLVAATSILVGYRAGGADSPPNESGVAHYLEHLMFRGTTNVPPGGFSRWVADHGGQDNAFTTADGTFFTTLVAPGNLAAALMLEADRMQNLAILPATAAPELNVVRSERRQRTSDDPEGRFVEGLRHVLFPGHPYGEPVVGTESDLTAMTPDKAEAFYRCRYAPSNALVVITGPLDAHATFALVAATLGRVPARPVCPRPPLPSAPSPVSGSFTQREAEVRQPQMTLQIIAPSRGALTAHGMSADAWKATYALEVVAEALGGETGVLTRRLVHERRVASALNVSYDPDVRGPTVFGVSATPAPGVAPETLKRALAATLREVARAGLAARDVRSAKRRLGYGALWARDSVTAPGLAFGTVWASGQRADNVEAWPDRLRGITHAEANAALRALDAEKRRVAGSLLPEVVGVGERP